METSITQKSRKRKRSRRIDFFGSFIDFSYFGAGGRMGQNKGPPFSSLFPPQLFESAARKKIVNSLPPTCPKSISTTADQKNGGLETLKQSASSRRDRKKGERSWDLRFIRKEYYFLQNHNSGPVGTALCVRACAGRVCCSTIIRISCRQTRRGGGEERDPPEQIALHCSTAQCVPWMWGWRGPCPCRLLPSPPGP